MSTDTTAAREEALVHLAEMHQEFESLPDYAHLPEAASLAWETTRADLLFSEDLVAHEGQVRTVDRFQPMPGMTWVKFADGSQATFPNGREVAVLRHPLGTARA